MNIYMESYINIRWREKIIHQKKEKKMDPKKNTVSKKKRSNSLFIIY